MKFNSIKNMKEDINNATIELYANKRVIIFDCKSVIDYSKECVVLDLGSSKLKLVGTDFVVDSFVFGQTDITGIIHSIEFV